MPSEDRIVLSGIDAGQDVALADFLANPGEGTFGIWKQSWNPEFYGQNSVTFSLGNGDTLTVANEQMDAATIAASLQASDFIIPRSVA
jgi:hypothetical protein